MPMVNIHNKSEKMELRFDNFYHLGHVKCKKVLQHMQNVQL